MMFTFSTLERLVPFLGKFGLKNHCLFKLKSGT